MNMTLRMEQWTPEKWQSEIDRMAGQSLDEERQEMISQIYGLPLRIRFLHRIRDERKFGSPEELAARIQEDIRLARAALNKQNQSSAKEELVLS